MLPTPRSPPPLATVGFVIAILAGLTMLKETAIPSIALVLLGLFLVVVRVRLGGVLKSLTWAVQELRVATALHDPLDEGLGPGMIIPVIPHPFALGGEVLLGRIREITGDDGVVEIISEPIWGDVYVPLLGGRSFTLAKGEWARYTIDGAEAALYAKEKSRGSDEA